MRKLLESFLQGPVNDWFLLVFAAVGTVVFIITGMLISTTIDYLR